MKKQEKKVEFTKELFFEISADKTTQIAQLRQDIDDTTMRIEGRVDFLKELSDGLKQLRINIRKERIALFKDRLRKFILRRDISIQNRFAKNLNSAYTQGEPEININRFYTNEEQKIR